MRHKFRSFEDCPKTCNEYGTCPICNGGISHCKVCDLAEGSLTTECPGEPCSAEKGDRVYAGEIDFKDGRWINGTSFNNPKHYVQEE